MKADLISLDGQMPPFDATLKAFPVIIGRAADAGIRLENHSINHYHCRIDSVGGELIVSDLSSRHGTWVNNCHIRKSPLRHGDELAVGMLSFLVQYYKRSKTTAPPH